MTDRIMHLKQLQWEHWHHAFRRDVPEDVASAYRVPSMRDDRRTAERLCRALELEEPVLFPGELIAFTRTVPNLPMVFTDAEWADIKGRHFIHELGNVSNLSPDYGTVIAHGLMYYREKALAVRKDHPVITEIDAVLRLTKRYALAAREAGLCELADTLAHVPAQGAETFREALQSLRILHYVLWCEGNYHNTLGRFDQYMLPWLEKDLASGRLTREQAFELVEAFFLSCNRDSDLYPGMQQGDNGQSMMLGGVTPDGGDGYHLLSEMCLDACEELRLIDPKINLRVDRNTPLSRYERATRLTRLGLGFPQYANDDVVIPGLIALGYRPEDARNYVTAACWEFIIPGKGMDIPNIGAVSLAALTDRAIREHLPQCASMEELLEKLKAAIENDLSSQVAGIRDLYVIPSPFLSLFFEGCLEKDADISKGCVYNNWGFHGTGLAPAADMLAAVQQAVFEGDTAPEVLLQAMEKDFVGFEPLHDRLKYHCAKFGNDEENADQYAVWLLHTYAEAAKGLRNERGGCIRVGTGSAMYYITHAEALGATADGREAGVPLPANYAPSLNIRLNGPLSLIRSFTKPALGEAINGGPMTIEFSDSVFLLEEAVSKVAQLVRLFILRGGHQLQLNTVNREKLLDAQRHPENYRNLIVRVWGWSGYFTELDKCYQDHIIRRAELTL